MKTLHCGWAGGDGPSPGRLLRREMRAIAALQRCLLPQATPRLDGWRIAVYFGDGRRPGGDYYDFFPLPDGRLAFLIADASAHGGAAAAMVAQARAVLHSCPLSSDQGLPPSCPLLGGHVRPPHVVLAHLDRALEKNSLDGQFMTAFYGVLDPASGALYCANAGHPPPRLWRAGTGVVEPLPRAGGPPLGVGLASSYSQAELTLDPGDVLVCYSDGLLEARNGQGQPFAVRGLDPAIRAAMPDDAEAIKLRLLASFAEFLSGRRPPDDVAVLVVQRTAEPHLSGGTLVPRQ